MHLAGGIATLLYSKWLLFIDKWCIRVPTGSENVVLLPTRTLARVHMHTYTDCVLCRIHPPWREVFALGHIYSLQQIESIYPSNSIYFLSSLRRLRSAGKERSVKSLRRRWRKRASHVKLWWEPLQVHVLWEGLTCWVSYQDSSEIFTVIFHRTALFVVVIHKGL